jgi:hypothetical protein
MRNRILTGSAFSVGLFLGVIFGFAGDPQSRRPASKPDTAAPAPSRPYLSTGFPQVVVVSGTDREMGIQYGEQAAEAIYHNVAIFKSRLYDSVGKDAAEKDMQVWDHYLTKHDPGYRDWLLGIREGCRRKGYEVSYIDLLMVLVYPTELWSRPKAPYPAETRIASARANPVLTPGRDFHSCNTFAAAGTAALPVRVPCYLLPAFSSRQLPDFRISAPEFSSK